MRLQKSRCKAPGPRQVRVRLEGCGVCGSNLPVWQGRPWFDYPLEAGAPGHEGWGIVEEVGGDVPDVVVGDRVALLSYHAFGEMELAAHDRVVVLPPRLGGMDFPGEALGCAMNVFRRCAIQAGQWVAVLGVGFMGAVITQLASTAGAKVIAISKRPASLAAARRMGALQTIPMQDHYEVIAEVGRLTNGQLCERVVEATGVQWPLDLAGEVCAERGRLVIAGYHQDGPRQINMQLWNWRGLDVINAHERDPQVYLAGMRAAVAAITGGRLDPSSLYTHRFRLPELGRALDLLESRGEQLMKALIRYD